MGFKNWKTKRYMWDVLIAPKMLSKYEVYVLTWESAEYYLYIYYKLDLKKKLSYIFPLVCKAHFLVWRIQKTEFIKILLFVTYNFNLPNALIILQLIFFCPLLQCHTIFCLTIVILSRQECKAYPCVLLNQYLSLSLESPTIWAKWYT